MKSEQMYVKITKTKRKFWWFLVLRFKGEMLMEKLFLAKKHPHLIFDASDYLTMRANFISSDYSAYRSKLINAAEQAWDGGRDANRKTKPASELDIASTAASELSKAKIGAACSTLYFLIKDDNNKGIDDEDGYVYPRPRSEYRDKAIDVLLHLGNGVYVDYKDETSAQEDMWVWHMGVYGNSIAITYDIMYNDLLSRLGKPALLNLLGKYRHIKEFTAHMYKILNGVGGWWTGRNGNFWLHPTGNNAQVHANQKILSMCGLYSIGKALGDISVTLHDGSAKTGDELAQFVIAMFFDSDITTDPSKGYIDQVFSPDGYYLEGMTYINDILNSLDTVFESADKHGLLTAEHKSRIGGMVDAHIKLLTPSFEYPNVDDAINDANLCGALATLAKFSSNPAQVNWLIDTALVKGRLYSQPGKESIIFKGVWNPANHTSVKPEIDSTVVKGSHILMRSSKDPEDHNAICIHVAANNIARRSHFHADQSSFSIRAKGAYLAIDPGYPGVDKKTCATYLNLPEEHQNVQSMWFDHQQAKHPSGHNLIGVDNYDTWWIYANGGIDLALGAPYVLGKYPYEIGSTENDFVTIEQVEFSDYGDISFTNVIYSKVKPYSLKIGRNFFFPGKRYLVIHDIVEGVGGSAEHTYHWRLHMGRSIDSDLSISDQTILYHDKVEDVCLKSKFIMPTSVTIVQNEQPCFLSSKKAINDLHRVADGQVTAEDTEFLTVLFPFDNVTENEPVFTPITTAVGGTAEMIDQTIDGVNHQDIVMKKDSSANEVSALCFAAKADLCITNLQGRELGYAFLKNATSYGLHLITSTEELPLITVNYFSTAVDVLMEATFTVADGPTPTITFKNYWGTDVYVNILRNIPQKYSRDIVLTPAPGTYSIIVKSTPIALAEFDFEEVVANTFVDSSACALGNDGIFFLLDVPGTAAVVADPDGIYDNTVYFAGKNEHIKCKNPENFWFENGDFTISFRFRHEDMWWGQFVKIGNTTENYSGIAFDMFKDKDDIRKVCLVVRDQDNNMLKVIDPADYHNDYNRVWVQFTGVREGNTFKLYRDGVLINSITDNSIGNLTPNRLTVPSVNEGKLTLCTGSTKGNMDNVKVFNCALSDSEVAALMQQ